MKVVLVRGTVLPVEPTGGALDTVGRMACGVAGWTMTEMTVEGVGHGSG